MLVFGALGVVFVGLVLFGLVVSWRDHRRGRVRRDADEMWQDNMREQARDIRSVERLHNIYDPDLSNTDWGRRNRGEK
jgi:hypothetical protein